MAVLSPALVVAMSVMFILTRLHQHFHIFEVAIFFGLKYCIQPDRQLLERFSSNNSSQPSSSSSSTPTVVKRDTLTMAAAAGASIGPGGATSSKHKLTVAALPVRRAKITPLFFSADSDFPYHDSVHHVLCLCCGYLAALLFESFLSCRFPHFLINTRSFYVAFFTIGYVVTLAWRISIFLSSLRVMLLFGAFSALVTLVLLSLGDRSPVFRSATAFDALYHALFIFLRARVHLEALGAARVASRIVSVMRIIFPALVAVCVTAIVVPARRFSMLDFRLRSEYLADKRDVAEDPYALPPPTLLTMLHLTGDYAAVLLCVVAFVLSGMERTPHALHAVSMTRALFIVTAVLLHLSLLRLRLQAYLDGAIDAFRRFWRLRVTMSVSDALTIATRNVVSTTYYLPMLCMAYLMSVIPPLLFVSVGLFNGHGGMHRLAVCRPAPVYILHPVRVFIGEVAPFMAWFLVAAYVVFASLSFCTEVLFHAAGLSEEGRPVKLPTSNSASERRRLKRLHQQQSVSFQQPRSDMTGRKSGGKGKRQNITYTPKVPAFLRKFMEDGEKRDTQVASKSRAASALASTKAPVAPTEEEIAYLERQGFSIVHREEAAVLPGDVDAPVTGKNGHATGERSQHATDGRTELPVARTIAKSSSRKRTSGGCAKGGALARRNRVKLSCVHNDTDSDDSESNVE